MCVMLSMIPTNSDLLKGKGSGEGERKTNRIGRVGEEGSEAWGSLFIDTIVSISPRILWTKSVKYREEG